MESGGDPEYEDGGMMMGGDISSSSGGGGGGLGPNETEDNLHLLQHSHPLYGPTLEEVTSTFRWVFWVHVYGFAFLFFFLAFYAFFSILNLRSQLSSRPYMTTINSFLCLLGASRASVLFIDPYGLQQRMPPVMASLLWDLGFPSLISSFGLIQIAFLQLTHGEVGTEGGFKKKTFLSLVITIHFMSIIISAIYSSFNSELMVGKMATQLLFTVWGCVLCGSFVVGGKKFFGGPKSPTVNEKGIVNLFGMAGLAGPGQNLASSLTAALAPTLLQGSSHAPKIQITDEHDRTVSVASDSSRLNDIPEVPETQPLTPTTAITSVAPSSPRSSFSAPGEAEPGTSSSSGTYVRPPSPVLPRRKSSGPGLRGTALPGQRRLSWRRDSGTAGSGSGEASSEGEVRKKSLTWCEEGVERISIAAEKRRATSIGRTSFEAVPPSASDRNGGATETLLSTATGEDYTLQSILSHIAYVNQTALDYRLNRKLSRTNQIEKVVKYTSYTAVLGLAVCVGELVRLLGPLGFFASHISTPSAWFWFVLQSIIRLCELGMGALVANITQQPMNRAPHHAFSMRHKHRESLYL